MKILQKYVTFTSFLELLHKQGEFCTEKLFQEDIVT